MVESVDDQHSPSAISVFIFPRIGTKCATILRVAEAFRSDVGITTHTGCCDGLFSNFGCAASFILTPERPRKEKKKQKLSRIEKRRKTYRPFHSSTFLAQHVRCTFQTRWVRHFRSCSPSILGLRLHPIQGFGVFRLWRAKGCPQVRTICSCSVSTHKLTGLSIAQTTRPFHISSKRDAV